MDNNYDDTSKKNGSDYSYGQTDNQWQYNQNKDYNQNQGFDQDRGYNQNQGYDQNQGFDQKYNYKYHYNDGQNGSYQDNYSYNTGSNGQNYEPGQDTSPMSMGDWLITMLVSMIPCVGFILYIVWAFSKTTNVNRRNFCRAQLVIMAVALAIYIIFIAIFGTALFGATKSLYY